MLKTFHFGIPFPLLPPNSIQKLILHQNIAISFTPFDIINSKNGCYSNLYLSSLLFKFSILFRTVASHKRNALCHFTSFYFDIMWKGCLCIQLCGAYNLWLHPKVAIHLSWLARNALSEWFINNLTAKDSFLRKENFISLRLINRYLSVVKRQTGNVRARQVLIALMDDLIYFKLDSCNALF